MKKIILICSLLTTLFQSTFSQELIPYSCYIDRVSVQSWMKYNGRKLDKEGILQNGNVYHPLSITQFGMGSYYHFKETNDSTYYRHYINQVKYFKDSTKVHYLHDGKSIGLPYTINFWDMKAPWYSGMTQGYAMSFLIRYWQDTKDESIVPIIKKIAHFQLQPESKNGTIGETPNGLTWIEEYPNSKKSPEVLNGFINGLIGLKEYCDFFPEDTTAVRIHKEAYEAMIQSLNLFDTPNWSHYNLNKRRIDVKYLRYQIFEMRHLYEIYKDPILLDQMKIWTFMVVGKKFNAKGPFSRKDFEPGKLMQYKDGILSYHHNLPSYIAKKDTSSRALPKDSIVTFDVKKMSWDVKLDSKKKISQLNLEMNTSHKKAPKTKLTYYDVNDSIIELSVKNVIQGDSTLTVNFDKEVKLSKVRVDIKHKKKKSIQFGQHSAYNLLDFSLPFYVCRKQKAIAFKKGEYNYDIKKHKNAEDITVFYRWAEKPNLIPKKKWINSNCFKGTNGTVTLPEDALYEFLIVYKPTKNDSYMSTFQLLKTTP